MKRWSWAFPISAAVLGLLAFFANPKPAPAPRPAPPPPPVAAVPGVPPAPVRAHGDGPLAFEATLSSAYVLSGSSEVHAVFKVTAPTLENPERKPVNLAVVIDRSASMGGAKLDAAKAAATALVAQLSAADRLAIVHYGDDVRSFPSTLATPVGKRRMSQFIQAIACEGSTDIGAALQTASSLLEPRVSAYSSSRVVLITDGQPTSGIVRPEALEELAASIHAKGIAITALGVGIDINDALMHGIAQNGAGFYGFLEDARQLEPIFQRELVQAGATVARALEVQLDLPAGVELIDVLGRPSRVDGRTVSTSLYDLASGQTAEFVARLRVSADAATTSMPIAHVRVSYVDARKDAAWKDAIDLSAEVTAAPQVVAANTSAEVETQTLQAVGVQEIARATEAFRGGRREEGLAIFDNVRQLFGASANALAGNTSMLDDARRQLVDARTPDEVARATISTNRRVLQNFGANLDTY